MFVIISSASYKENGVIKKEYINTRQNLDDYLTKPSYMVLCSCACDQKSESIILIMAVNDFLLYKLDLTDERFFLLVFGRSRE